MARTFKRKDRMGAMTEINVTPLIDLAFALLIIFIISTPLLEETIPLQLPLHGPSLEAPKADTKFQNISIDSNKNLFWGKEKIDHAQLNELLRGLTLQDNPPILHIRGAKDVPYQEVITVLDAIKQHNLSKISLDTQVW